MKVSIRQQHAVLNESIRSKRLRGLRLRLRIAAVLLGVMGFVFSDTAYANPAEPNPTMRVRVLNHTQATPATVAQAEREAARILGEASVKTVWLDCPLVEAKVVPQDPCQQPLEANEIMVRVLSDKTRRGYQDNAFGFAVAPLLASVYYEHAERLARIDDAKFEVPIILGCVMVHEIGHLLLGYNSHSDSGIMQSHWERKQVRQLMMGGLTFTGQQSQRIRTEVQMRLNQQTAQVHESSQKLIFACKQRIDTDSKVIPRDSCLNLSSLGRIGRLTLIVRLHDDGKHCIEMHHADADSYIQLDLEKLMQSLILK